MPTVQHSALTTGELHEPKGVDTASLGEVYVADGAGSGTWEPAVAHFGGYISFDAVTPAYAHSATTSDTVLNPTFLGTTASEFSSTTTPNARITYTGTDTRVAFLRLSCAIQQASGSSRDIELVFYKNGSALAGSRTIRSTTTSSWGSVSLGYDVSISTNDYIEVFIKASAATTVNFASAYLGIQAPLV